MDKKYLLEKIFDKYHMEIARKGRLEAKAVGYYTIIGVFLAGFLVIEPLLFAQDILVKFSAKDILAIINYLLVGGFIVIFIISICLLHDSYKPKSRPEFDPIENWDTLTQLDEDNKIESIKDELIKIIQHYVKHNGIIAKKLKVINSLCISCALIIVAIFLVLTATYYVKNKGTIMAEEKRQEQTKEKKEEKHKDQQPTKLKTTWVVDSAEKINIHNKLNQKKNRT